MDIGTPEALQAMLDELRRADPIYAPSKFWEFHGAGHIERLDQDGLDRFKQTINQSYFNWLPTAWTDHQLRNALYEWHRNPTLGPLHTRMIESVGLGSVHQAEHLGTTEQREIYTFFVGLLWEYALRNDRYGVLETLEEPSVGRPIGIEREGKRISQDLANSVREYNRIRETTERAGQWNDQLVLGEIGAGYGRLAYVFAKHAPGRYLVFDIPPTLHIAQWYLKQTCPELSIFGFRPFEKFADVQAELERSKLAFFTPNQLALFPDDYFDAIISISSLAEMTREQVDRYKSLMDAKAQSFTYLKQWQQHYNMLDKLHFEESLYHMGGKWTVLDRRIDPIQDDFVELIQGKKLRKLGEAAPTMTKPTPEAERITQLEAKVAELQRERIFYSSEADKRLTVIQGLDTECKRLSAILGRAGKKRSWLSALRGGK